MALPKGPASVDLLAEADELDAQVIELGQDVKKVLHASGQPVGGPDQQNVEVAPTGSGQHLIEPGAAGAGAGDAVGIFGRDLKAALASQLAQVPDLGFRMLIKR